MKKSISFLTIALAGMLFITSCQKHHKGTHATQTINATVEMNKAYQFDMGNVSKRETAKITEQARHFTLSETSDVNGEGHTVYNYLPAMNYTGTDEVSITIAEGHHGCANHDQHACGNNNCQHHDDDDDDDDNSTTYIIKITVTRSNTPTTPVLAQNSVN